MIKNPDALPQLIGDFAPVDEWQSRINRLFYGLQGEQVRKFYQTFSSADYRLAHALAADYFARVQKREQARGNRQGAIGQKQEETSETHRPSPIASRLVVHEWGPGNGNLAGCFLSHLKQLDQAQQIYPRVRYVLVGPRQSQLDAALAHPALAPHRDRVSADCADVQSLSGTPDGSVDLILCLDLWNELATKLLVRKEGEIEEEYVRPNLKEEAFDRITDWSGFVRAFENLDLDGLKQFPPFLGDIVWEKEYRKLDWKSVAFRKTITDHLKLIDEHVLAPINLGAHGCLKEAKRVLAADAVGLQAFDAGTAQSVVLNDPEKPCYGFFGGQQSFMVNFLAAEAVAGYLEFKTVTLEPQREFVGRILGDNVMSLMDLLAAFPAPKTLAPWEQDRVVLRTIDCLNRHYANPYAHPLEFPLQEGTPAAERREMEAMLQGLKRDGVPDTVAYLTEREIMAAVSDLAGIGYDQEAIRTMLQAPPQPVDYYCLSCCPQGGSAGPDYS